MLSGDLRDARTQGLPSGLPIQSPSARDYHSLVVLQTSSEQSGLYWVSALESKQSPLLQSLGASTCPSHSRESPEGDHQLFSCLM